MRLTLLQQAVRTYINVDVVRATHTHTAKDKNFGILINLCTLCTRMLVAEEAHSHINFFGLNVFSKVSTEAHV